MTTSDVTYRDDEPERRRIGPWAPSGAPDLSDFDPDTNFVVRAAAGSGKTTALVGRMVALVRTGVPVEDLTAITFTRKAAGEMSARFARELEEARQALPQDSREYRRIVAALGNVQSTFIGTIHAFCSRLLRERPLEAGLPPDFTAGLSDRDERDLRRRAWTEHLNDLHTGDGDELEQLAACGLDPQDLADFFQRLCRFPNLDLFTDGPSTPPDLSSAVAEATDRMRAWNAYRPDEPAKGPDPVMAAFDKAERMHRYLDLDKPDEQAAFLSVFTDVSSTDKAKVKTTYWKGNGINHSSWAKELRDDLFPALIEDTVKPAIREWEAYVHRVAVRCTAPAVDRFRELRRREGLLTFHDLLSLTRDMLRDRPDVRRAVQDRYPRLLVDEFQDTDPLQAEILSFLSSQTPDTTDWRACRPRDGSLFIVGDDKQSIYRFRRADKDVFEAFRKRIHEEPNGEAVDLTKNFRSRAPICTWCNDVFDDLFGADQYEDVQAEYVPFNPQRPAGPDGTALRTKPIGDVSYNRARQIAEEDARQIAAFIQGAHNGDAHPDFYTDEEGAVFAGEVDYSDFLILTRVRSRLSTYTDTLAKYGIPYMVTGSRDMSESAELKAVVDLLRTTLRPDDPVAAVAFLKGLLVGMSDTDLYRYVEAGGSLSDIRAPDDLRERSDLPERSDLSEEAAARARDAVALREEVRAIVDTVRPSTGMEQIVETTGLLAGAAHPDQPSEASARAGAVLRLLHFVQSLGSQGLGWSEVLEELDRVLQGEEEMDGMTLETGRDDAVRIMNVHQAKGLEAPVVFLADPYSSGSSPEPEDHVRREHDDVVVPVVRGEGVYSTITHAPRGWHEDTEPAFLAEEKRQEEAEEHRLLYVAATRAERLLVVSTYPKKAGAGYWGALAPHLEETPELQIPEVDPPDDGQHTAPAPDLDGHATRLREQVDRLAAKSFDEVNVTDEKDGAGSVAGNSATGRDGYGRALGTALHRVLEALIRHRHNPPSFSLENLKQALVAEGILRRNREEREKSKEHLDDRAMTLRAMVDAFQTDALWEEIQAADEVYTEHPFAVFDAQDKGRNGADTDRAEDAPPTLRRGSIDVLYRTGSEWTIVDFKSDRLTGDDPVAAAREAASGGYADQVRAYAEAWQRLQDEPLRRAGLWFGDGPAFVDVEIADPS